MVKTEDSSLFWIIGTKPYALSANPATMADIGDVVEIVVISMRDSFLAVTVFVAVMVFLFSWLQYATSGRFVEYIRERKKLQPVIGALMGLTPGCGGAIVMMPMYARGYVTYGTVIATLIAVSYTHLTLPTKA